MVNKFAVRVSHSKSFDPEYESFASRIMVVCDLGHKEDPTETCRRNKNLTLNLNRRRKRRKRGSKTRGGKGARLITANSPLPMHYPLLTVTIGDHFQLFVGRERDRDRDNRWIESKRGRSSISL